MTFQTRPMIAALVAAFALVGCGGGGGGGGDDSGSTPTPTPTPTPSPTTKFTQSGSLSFELPASGQSVCYDLDTQPATTVADCSGTLWDVKVTSAGLYATLWTNSGSSGTGKGGAFGGPFAQTWEQLQAYSQGDLDPVSGTALPTNVYTSDSSASVFASNNSAGSAAFEYGVSGSSNDHNMYPNFRVFVVTTDNTTTTDTNQYALQITNYYSAANASGHPTLRWIKRDGSEAVPKEVTFNAATGWVYVDLATGTTTTEDGGWHIALNRLQVKLNGGVSATNGGKVAGFVGLTPSGFYDASGNPVVSQFTSPPLNDLKLETLLASVTPPARVNQWVADKNGSALNPTYKGSYPNALDYGWFTYYSSDALAEPVGLKAHMIKANAANGSLIRSGEGNGYARIHVSDIQYADVADRNSKQTWTLNYDVQPSVR